MSSSYSYYPHATSECFSEAFSSPPVAPLDNQWSCYQWPSAVPSYEGCWTPQHVQNPAAHAWQQWQAAQNPFAAYPTDTPASDALRTLKKPPRNTFTGEQLRILNKFFHADKYLTKETKEIIAAQTRLTQRQVKIWFQNQRYKWKKSSPSSTSD